LQEGPDETLLAFLCEMLHPVVRPEGEVDPLVDGINALLSRDGWELVETSSISGRPVFSARRRPAFDLSDLGAAKTLATQLDPDYLMRQITRMESTVIGDPEAAIGAAKDFVETVCKTILENAGVSFSRTDDLPRLSKLVSQSVCLLSRGTTAEIRGTELMQRFVSNVGSAIQSLAEIRGLYGTGHGKAAGFVGLTSAHARFAISCASALGVFLVECHQADSSETKP
jgi:hypothetical protein